MNKWATMFVFLIQSWIHLWCLYWRLVEIIWMETKTLSGTNPMQMHSDGHLTQSCDSLLPHNLGFSHTVWHFSESMHQSSHPAVVKSDNPIITAILNGLIRSEVSLAIVCTASPPALTRLCRFMQMRSNPRDEGDSGDAGVSQLDGLLWAAALGVAQGVRSSREGDKERKKGWMREVWWDCWRSLKEGGSMNGEDKSERAAARR